MMAYAQAETSNKIMFSIIVAVLLAIRVNFVVSWWEISYFENKPSCFAREDSPASPSGIVLRVILEPSPIGGRGVESVFYF